MSVNLTEVMNVLKVEIVKGKNDYTYEQLHEEIGVRFIKGQQSPVGERVRRLNGIITVGEATNLIYNVGTNDGVNVLNSFDYLPQFKAKDVIVDGDFFREFDGAYLKYEEVKEGATTYQYYWTSLTQHKGYFWPHCFLDNDGVTKKPSIFVGRYKAFRDGENKLRSIPNVMPTINRSAANFLTDARLNDGLGILSKYLIGDIWEKCWFNFRQMIRMGIRHVQSVLVGATNLPYSSSHATIGDQTDSNELVLTNSHASGYVVGQSIVAGTSQGSDNRLNVRQIVKIEADTPEAGQTTITFDGEPTSILEGVLVTSRAWITGTTDGIVATDGYYEANNGKYSCKIDGIENPFGDIWENIAGIKVNDHKVYVAVDTSKYNWDDNTTDYYELGYELPKSNGYAKEMGYDPNFPLANLPIEVGGSNAEHYADYFYQNTDWRTVLLGGTWTYTSDAGLWCWVCNSTLGYPSIRVGARLSYRP